MNQKGVIQLVIPAVVLVLAVLGVTTSNITTTTNFSDSPQILGENETAKKAAEQAKEAAQKEAEQKKEVEKKSLEQIKESTKINIQSEGKKSEMELETSSGQKIKTKVEDDGTTKIEIEDEDKDEIEDEEASGSADEDLDELRSISKFPLRIDTATNQLIMTKNGVERVLTVLPAKAVQNMLRAHLKKGLGPKFFGDATSSASPSAEPVATQSAGITVLEDQISLEEEDGQIAYKIPAIKKLKIFGIIPITTNFTSFVSAETGALIKEQESLLSKILNFLSR